jgi:hypothetical protein
MKMGIAALPSLSDSNIGGILGTIQGVVLGLYFSLDSGPPQPIRASDSWAK